jgi:hypothetical protein
MVPTADITASDNRGVKVLAVHTKGGQTIAFDEQCPGRVNEDRIEGYVPQPVHTALAKSQIERTVRGPWGRTTSIWSKDQKEYAVDRITADTSDSLSFVTLERVPLALPLADVDSVSVRHVDVVGPVSAAVIISGALVAMVAASWGGAFGGWGSKWGQ